MFNELCKTCSRHHVIPKSMHIQDCSEESVVAEHGGSANISRGTYKGRRVAVKVVRVHTSDLNIVFGVSIPLASLHLPVWICCRGFAGRESPGSTSDIKIFYHCSG